MTIKKIHQIWIADDNAEPSDFIKNQMFEVKQKYNDYEYKLWSNNDIIDFISKHFDKDVLLGPPLSLLHLLTKSLTQHHRHYSPLRPR